MSHLISQGRSAILDALRSGLNGTLYVPEVMFCRYSEKAIVVHEGSLLPKGRSFQMITAATC
jgi:hypothetical protein